MSSRAHESGHPTPVTYAKVAALLAIITAIEFIIFYIEAIENVVVPMFLILSAVKFAMVSMFYMHLKFDSKIFSGFYVGGLILATSVIMALLALFSIVSGERIVVAVAEEPAAGDHATDTSQTTDTGTATDASTDTSAMAADATHEIGSASSDEFQFTIDSLTATSGEEVTLRFTNNAVTQQHNWVMVQDGTKDEVATAGLVDPVNWLNADDPNVIASVRLLNPGESAQVTFTAPAAGAYQFVCTYPGHNATMFGTFEVAP
jgi:cytochrome c oxidase subunit 4